MTTKKFEAGPKRWSAVVVAAGRGTRMGTKESKQYLELAGKPILVHTLQIFERMAEIGEIVLVTGADDVERCSALVRDNGLCKVTAIVAGGSERQHSVRIGLAAASCDWVMVHDGVRPLTSPEAIRRVIEAAYSHDAAVLAVPVKDTIKQVSADGLIAGTPDRKTLWAIQTPQAFRRELLAECHARAAEEGFLGTDDAMAVERYGRAVAVAEGEYTNIKVTTPDDLAWAAYLLQSGKDGSEKGESCKMIRIGQGFDVHQLVEGRPCIIGGVTIPYEKGLLGHSDADVLLHAVADAVLGALALGDIGKHFPDTDPLYKDADSVKLLERVWELAKERGYKLGNIDSTIIAQRPKMAPYIPQMAEVIARVLEADVSQVNVKATTSEQLGFTGRGEGIAAQSVVCLVKAVL
jgi:2-C-methyl-D-erythritol 4-phosphate cytidylyltransferase/2-C-methyl-D-erythritol 2,4-cyclodiphosphate synthase